MSFFHMVDLKSLCLVFKFEIFLLKVDIKLGFLSELSGLLSKKAEAKSKHFSERLFSEIFGKSFLLGVSSRYQRPQKYQ